MYNVLLVDDEIVAVNALKNRVDWQKYQIKEVYTARSMRQAQELFKSHTIDLMFCDIEMPGGSGLELFEWVKNFFPQVECIYISCHPDYHYIRQAMKLGSFDYMLKPVDFGELDQLLNQVLPRMALKPRSQSSDHSQVYTTDEMAQVKSPEDMGITDETVFAIRTYIEGNIKNDISINAIATHVHLNPVYVMRLFKQKTGQSIVEYITALRLEKAKELLLHTTYSVQKVAEEVGYDNYSYFTRLFKKRMKTTPVLYRKEQKG